MCVKKVRQTRCYGDLEEGGIFFLDGGNGWRKKSGDYSTGMRVGAYVGPEYTEIYFNST